MHITRLFQVGCYSVCLLLGASKGYASTPASTPSSSERLPGVTLAEGISQITGVAISPLLGVSTMGAWRYYRTPDQQRHLLPWFCHPYAFGLGFFILSMCFVKDILGTATPSLIKKPFDVVELFENKLSALVASAAFVPLIVSQMTPLFSNGGEVHAVTTQSVIAASFLPAPSFSLHIALMLLFVPAAILSFLTIWMANHVIHVLIILSPFGFIDNLLKLIKMTLLSSVFLSYLVTPFLAAGISLLILLAAICIAPWAFRLTVFGTLLAADIILPAWARRHTTFDCPHGFLARTVLGVPTRTYGHLTRAAGGTLQFLYRPWLIFPPRTVPLPSTVLEISRGILFPSLLQSDEPGGKMSTLLIFMPRYRDLESFIATHFSISGIHDDSLLKGFRAIRLWFADILGFETAPPSSGSSTP